MSAYEESRTTKQRLPIFSVPIDVDQRVQITFCPVGEFPGARVNLTFCDEKTGKTARFYISGGVFKKQYEEGEQGEEELVNDRLKIKVHLSDPKADMPDVSMDVSYRLSDGTDVQAHLDEQTCDAIFGALQALTHNQPHLKLVCELVNDRSQKIRKRR